MVKKQKQKEIKYNIQFRGEDRIANWFSESQLLKNGERINKQIPKYSTTDYDEVCIIFDGRGIKTAEDIWHDDLFYVDTIIDNRIKEFCSNLEPAGPASTIETRPQAAIDNQGLLLTEGEGI